MSAPPIFTTNSKTILSLDFDRFTTCDQICAYCYVGNLEKLYKAYKPKIERNETMATDNPKMFASALNKEYRKYRRSKAKAYHRLDKLPVRIYGSGDFKEHHLEFLKLLDFKFYIISKNITQTHMLPYINRLKNLRNLTKIILSFDDQNMANYKNIKNQKGLDKIGLAYTGTADSFGSWKKKGLDFTIFFNISKKHKEMEKSRVYKESCPCDSGLIPHEKSCSTCNKCWRSTVTKGKQWNII